MTLEVCGEKEEFVAVHYPSDKNSFFQNKDLKLFVAMKRFRDPKWKLYTYEALGGAILVVYCGAPKYFAKFPDGLHHKKHNVEACHAKLIFLKYGSSFCEACIRITLS